MVYLYTRNFWNSLQTHPDGKHFDMDDSFPFA